MKAIMRKVTCVMAVMAVMIGIISPEVKAASVKYKTYNNSRFAYNVKYPTTFTSRADYGTGDGTKLKSADGKASATIWTSYGKSKRNGKTVVETAKKSRKITVKKASAKECNYSYVSGKNVVQYYYCFLSNGEIAFQITYPKAQSKFYEAAVKGMMTSCKTNKKLTLKD
ncbi:MAG: hypothetical protein NC293_08830 [Roseburia sp.]|nr:hypothetical protein [Roseburia sp.]